MCGNELISWLWLWVRLHCWEACNVSIFHGGKDIGNCSRNIFALMWRSLLPGIKIIETPNLVNSSQIYHDCRQIKVIIMLPSSKCLVSTLKLRGWTASRYTTKFCISSRLACILMAKYENVHSWWLCILTSFSDYGLVVPPTRCSLHSYCYVARSKRVAFKATQVC